MFKFSGRRTARTELRFCPGYPGGMKYRNQSWSEGKEGVKEGFGLKHFKYLSYVLRHKWFVFVECCKHGIAWRGIIHDASKFLPSEWFPYVENFYGEFGYKYNSPAKWTMPICCKVKSDFDLAWLHHQKRNKHHWQWWILQNDTDGLTIIDMPLKYRKEMLADWIGAGIAITGKRDIKEWYFKNKEKIQIHPNTRAWIEQQLFGHEL
jgi:hypothetical protein